MSGQSKTVSAVLRRMDDAWTASNPPTTFVLAAVKVALEMASEATAAERDRCTGIVRAVAEPIYKDIEYHRACAAILAAIEGETP